MHQNKNIITPRSDLYTRGFTIVELLIVIIVIAILALITTVAYNGITKRAARSTVQSTLASAATAMKAKAVDVGDYSTIPSNLELSDNIGVALTILTAPATAATSFCINGTYMGMNDIAYHITEAGTVEEGLCPGAVIVSTIVGNYNHEAVGSVPGSGVTGKRVDGDKYDFVVEVNNDWTQVNVRWSAQASTAHYEIMTNKNVAVPSWQYRSTTTGGSSCSGGISPTCTNGVPAATTSLTWTDTVSAVPTAPGQTFEYRLRPCPNAADSTGCGEWTTVSLANPVQSTSDVPAIQGFTVSTSSDWSNVTLSWNAPDRFAANMSAIHYEIMTNTNTASPSWLYRSTAAGAGNCMGGISPTCSNGITPATTSLTWTDTTAAIPYAPGQTYQYRIRVCANATSTYCGEWSQRSIANPIQTSTNVPTVSGFSVTQAADWSNITLSWNAVSNFATNMSGIHYEIMTNVNQSSPAWAYRSTAAGAGTCMGGISPTCSNGITPATTSLTWTDSAASVPTLGKTYDYRIRVCANATATYCGDWSTKSLTR